ncbi:sensor histidine kinase [Cryptosporangium aurantiacum]|uniref:histidine kinase n=1 Tax=Cryptosporangium aurantiacum TaxID=134849 RepID=A0A1M7QWW7_9ACTN|nr:histidine kinase [Cryptosporangium aurantiacum]SHN36127.1 Signal transduction histidine kinase [Cryptosporangium aurantiacum]
MGTRRRVGGVILLVVLVTAGELVTVAAAHPAPIVLAGYAVAVGAVVLASLRWPAAAFFAALVLAAVGGFGYVLLLWVAFRAGRASSSVVVAGAAIGALGVPIAAAVADPAAWSQYAAAYLVFVALPLAAGRYLHQHARLVDALTDRNQELRRARDLAAERERLRERLRIAREMHDALGHRLGLVSIQAAALEVDELPPRQREAIGRLAGSAREAVDGLHEVVGALRHGDEIDAPGLDGLDALVDGYVRAGVPVTVERRGEPGLLTDEADRAVYRAVEEGLTNATKHAPTCAVTVSLGWEDDALLLTVVNPIRPTPAPSPARPAAGGPGLGPGQVGAADVGGAGLGRVGSADAGWADAGAADMGRVGVRSAQAGEVGLGLGRVGSADAGWADAGAAAMGRRGACPGWAGLRPGHADMADAGLVGTRSAQAGGAGLGPGYEGLAGVGRVEAGSADAGRAAGLADAGRAGVGSVGVGGAVAVARGGHGLVGVRERIESVGGYATLRRDRGEARLTVLVPTLVREPEPVAGVGRGRSTAVGVATAVLLFGALPAAMLVGAG